MLRFGVVVFFAFISAFSAEYGLLTWDGKPLGGSNGTQRGYEKLGDSNYIKSYQDREIYGSRNAYQGSRAGDDDWSSRNIQQINQDHDEQMRKSRSY